MKERSPYKALEDKTELLKRYDFGGFGNARATLNDTVEFLARWGYMSDLVERANSVYQRMWDLYETIPFDELDEDDADFFTLFMTRDYLRELKTQLPAFLERVRRTRFLFKDRRIRNSGEYSELQLTLRKLGIVDMYPRYRDTINLYKRALRILRESQDS